jgi:Patatin-like phospholipase
MAKNLRDPFPDYVERTWEILEFEKENYLKERREKNGLPPPTDDNLNGLCISGGGVRAATLGLGMLQIFIKNGILKHFDYLSTVSGGGYIGSCLTSLMSDEPKYCDKEGKIPIKNQHFNAAEVGLESDSSPFVGLNDSYEYNSIENAKLKVKHQLHHLRRHGEYLTPNKKFLGWDVNQAIGALVGGIFIHVPIFILMISSVVLLHHALLFGFSNDNFINDLRNPPEAYIDRAMLDDEMTRDAGTLAEIKEKSKAISSQLKVWYYTKFKPQLALAYRPILDDIKWAIIFLGLGVFIGIIMVRISRRYPLKIVKDEAEEIQYDGENHKTYFDRQGGQNILQLRSRPFIFWFRTFTYAFPPLLAYVLIFILILNNQIDTPQYFMLLGLPLCYAVGLFISVNTYILLYAINKAQESVSGSIYRSFYSGMQGTAFMGCIVALIFPLAIVLLFGGHGIAFKLATSFVPVALAYYFTMQTFGGKSDSPSFLNKIISSLRMPLLNLSIFLFSGLAFAGLSNALYELEKLIVPDWGFSYAATAIILFVICIVGLIILGFLANSNDISLHYFYRDRLSAAYLRTQGRVQRPEAKTDYMAKHKELFDITIRDHENLKLKDVGDGNGKGPYHLIVTALNLQGSNDLAKKTLKSDHFIFSKFFVGSRSTGYYRTDKYNGGSTKLSSAMAISAAAVSSGMGSLSFAASNFYMTLLNLRTGYWVHNPWFLQKEDIEEKLISEGKMQKNSFKRAWEKFFKKHPFWLTYLASEFTGMMNSQTQRVNVSDGGHTGDNIGLLPLIQRQCRTIVACDFEEDGKFSFGSFGQAVRLAKAIYNTDIEIDLRPMIPEKQADGSIRSKSSVAIGKITYNDNGKQMEGRLIYMKSSVNFLEENMDKPLIKSQDKHMFYVPAPVFILNYYKSHPDFPHQSTADQYFDEIQFEAYRMLGEHITKQAVNEVKKALEIEEIRDVD